MKYTDFFMTNCPLVLLLTVLFIFILFFLCFVNDIISFFYYVSNFYSVKFRFQSLLQFLFALHNSDILLDTNVMVKGGGGFKHLCEKHLCSFVIFYACVSCLMPAVPLCLR